MRRSRIFSGCFAQNELHGGKILGACKAMVVIRWIRFALVMAPVMIALSGCPYNQDTVLFNGKNLSGWFISQSSAHGNSAAWSVANGQIEGMQDTPGNGGILLTEGVFGDFYVQADVKPDEGMDSGLFLRSTESGETYQVTIDLVEKGTVGCLFGEQLGTGFLAQNENWRGVYRVTDWNTIGASIRGNPPQIDVWINGTHVLAWQDTEVRLPDTGHVGLQVHGGERFDGFKMRARNIFVRSLPPLPLHEPSS